MTKDVNLQPQNVTFADETPNIIEKTTQETEQGILYQSFVVSNEMNGILNAISNNVRNLQLTGGYYTPEQAYYSGMVCSVVMEENAQFGGSVKYFECINDENGRGIIDQAPLLTQNFRDNGGVRTYIATEAQVNKTYWKMLSGAEAALKKFVEDEINNMKKWVQGEVTALKNEMNSFKSQVNNRIAQLETTINEIEPRIQSWVNERLTAFSQQITAIIAQVSDTWVDIQEVKLKNFDFSNYTANNFFVQDADGASADSWIFSLGQTGERSGTFLCKTNGELKGWFKNGENNVTCNIKFPLKANHNGYVWIFYKYKPGKGVAFTTANVG